MRKIFHPIVVLFGYVASNGLYTFVGRRAEISIHGYTEELQSILSLCNGFNSIDFIKEKLTDIPSEVFDALIDWAKKFEVIMDSRDLYLQFQSDSSKYSGFYSGLSPEQVVYLTTKQMEPLVGKYEYDLNPQPSKLTALLSRRSSGRSFSGKPLREHQLLSLLTTMYGRIEGVRTTPSAGGLYPLRIYFILLREHGEMPRGLYGFDPVSLKALLIDEGIPAGTIQRIFDSTVLIDGAAAVIFVVGVVKRSAAKYANRAYRFCLLEAGHVMQNAYLCAAEQDFSVLEYGGFDDELASKLLKLKAGELTLSSMIIGQPAEATDELAKEFELRDQSFYLQKRYLGSGKPVKNLVLSELSIGRKNWPRVYATAEYQDDNNLKVKGSSHGSAFTSHLAIIKAVAESVERYASGTGRVDLEEVPNRMTSSWLDPEIWYPYHQKIYSMIKNLQKFSRIEKMQWVEGEMIKSKEKFYIPADFVYYPFDAKSYHRKLIGFANSSGVAAHFSLEDATESALLELIERDAAMVTWYSKRHVTALSPQLFNDYMRERVEVLNSYGYVIKALNLTLDSVPVVQILIHSSVSLPSLVSGTAAAYTVQEAMEKAFHEAETMLLTWRKSRQKNGKISQVSIPSDHGRVYFSHANLQRVKWLLDASIGEVPSARYVMDDLIDKFDPYCAVLLRGMGKGGLWVVRVGAKNLLPINFGVGTEHYGHRRLNMLNLRWKRRYPSFPHYFA